MSDPVSSARRIRSHLGRSRRRLLREGRGAEVALADMKLIEVIQVDERRQLSPDPMVNILRGGVATFARWLVGLPPSPLLAEGFRGLTARSEARASLLAVLRMRGAVLAEVELVAERRLAARTRPACSDAAGGG